MSDADTAVRELCYFSFIPDRFVGVLIEGGTGS